MEAFAIALYAAAGLIAAPLFCFLVARWAPRFPALATVAWRASLALLVLFTMEYGAVQVVGAANLRANFGPLFVALHSVVTLLAAPALACTILAGPWRMARWWPAVAALSWTLGVFAIFFNYDVFDALDVIDVANRPRA